MNEHISLLKELEEKVREHTKGFYHSSKIVEYSVNGKRVTFDLRDISLASALAGLNMLFTSRTGSGKTTFAKMFLQALFGEDYAFIQADTKLGEDKLRNIDFGKIKEGGNLSEAIVETKMITAPAVIIDEGNRAPPQLLSILQGYLTNGTLVFEGGRELRPGVRTKSGDRYQIKIGTINEGEEYYGTYKMDKAFRDRFAVEINLDIFEPTEEDRRNLMRYGPARLPENPPESSLEKVLEVYEIVKEVPLSALAEEFIAYFMRMNQCIKSPEGTKLTVTGIGGEFCKGCSAFAPDRGICANVYAPSERTIANWIRLSKAFALYRAYKLNEEEYDVKVEIEDVIAAAPFVLYSKLSINPNWVTKYARGSLYNAVNEVVRIAYDRFMRGLKENKDLIQRMINARNNGNEPSEEDKDLAVRYCERDPWFFSKEYVKRVRKIRESINEGR